jgi:aminopeptidase N
VLIDPTLTLLAKWKLEIPQTMLIATAKSGPTLGSRLNAIATLGARARPEAVAALVDVLNDEKAFYGLRAEAAEALGLVQLPAARDALLAALKPEQLVADHKVRRAVVEAVAKYRHPDVAAVLRRIAARDASYAVEAEATQALGGQSPDDANVDVLLANAKKLAPRDQVRVAAVRALGQLGDPRGLDAALGVAAYGQPFRSRPAGVDAVGEIGKDASVRAKARDALIAMLQDVQDRPRRNVIRALGTLGDAKALPELRKIADGPDEANAKAAQDAIDAITKATGDSAVIRDLRDRIERLERKTSTTQPSARE